jgi:two-component system nitrogen regulation response regulator GlnG
VEAHTELVELVEECFSDEIRSGQRANDEDDSPESSSTDLARFVDQRMSAGTSDLYAESLEWMERYLLSRVLQTHNGNQSKAAEQLGITRGSLRHKLTTLGISIQQVVSASTGDD